MSDRKPTDDADETPDAVAEPEGRVARAGGVAVAILFGLLFAWQLFQAISNAVAYPQVAAVLGQPVPWWLLILGIALPPLVYTAAYLIGRRLGSLFARALVFVIALAASSALALSVNTLGRVLLG